MKIHTYESFLGDEDKDKIKLMRVNQVKGETF